MINFNLKKEKDKIISELQSSKHNHDQVLHLQQSLSSAMDEIRILKQKEKRLDLLVDQNKEDYEYQISDLKTELQQLSKSKDILEVKQKEIQQTLQREIEQNNNLMQKIENIEQKQEQTKREKDILEDDLNEIVANLKLDIKIKDKKILEQQNQIDVLQNKIARLNDDLAQESKNFTAKKNNYSATKRENQLNKSFDDIYYNKIKEDIFDANQQQNNYTNYIHYKERGQRSNFGDLLKQNVESPPKNQPSHQNIYERANKNVIISPQKSLERIQGGSGPRSDVRIESNQFIPYQQSYIDENHNNSYNNFNTVRNNQPHHQKGLSGDKIFNNGNSNYTINHNTNNPSNQKQIYNRISSQADPVQPLNNRQHYQNNNYYEEIYMNYQKNTNVDPQPLNNFTQNYINSNNNNNINNNNNNINYNIQNKTNSSNMTKEPTLKQVNNEKSRQQQLNYTSNSQQQDEPAFNYRHKQKPSLTFPSNQNYENNHQQIRQIEQALTNLNMEKQQLEAQMLKLPIHQKNAQQRLQKHTIEKNLEQVEKEISNNRKKLKQFQNV